ncbi:xanthine dehydrogenase family protein molybdopterin-binding subunit [Pseudorhodoplanes sp.]|uniref:xanthine dehydrogenase family protein molybdopterin-binding subunit n=1 Tax=Pseudorhodoplanes sp. TaxID=1934341 RepID=UPI002C3B2D18|nr:xanthine dehydrogenase family protein molybdopterin-binding subunit [Pseudorhodoplanes sp.]HWV54807.1 xanthine dehydrogenase family protein molybdopterin-binding subunit [Pseudorhodoplanes sp.]
MTKVEGLVGARVARPEARRLVEGRGRYTDDISANAGHVAFLRSPHAHATIEAIDVAAAASSPGVIAVVTATDLERVCKPWQTRLAALPNHVSPPQFPLARNEVTWQGEPVAAVVAASRAQAEDAVERIVIEWGELPAVGSPEASARPKADKVNSALPGNLGFAHDFSAGDPAAAFAAADLVVEHDFTFGRQTGVTLEPRSILADFDARLRKLTVHHSHQVPNQMRDIFAAQFDLPFANVQVIVPDIGGAFGMKLSAYPDEMAVAAIAILLGRPVKFVADRLESFVSDVHAREMKVKARLAVDVHGTMQAMDISVLHGMGAYSSYPRGSLGEGLQSVHMSAAPYRLGAFSGNLRSYFQNKTPSGVLRAVGQPIACTVTEQLIDLAARALGLDPAAMRRRNYARSGEQLSRSIAGTALSEMSLDRCHDRLLSLMNYDALRGERDALRGRSIYRGIGLAAFIEQTGVGPQLYGPLDVRVSAHETCRLSLEPNGEIRCATSVTDQGQGTLTALRQIVGTTLGVGIDAVDIVSGDTTAAPFGGGAWASRGTALGGESALRAARQLRTSILAISGSILQTQPDRLRIEAGMIVNAAGLAQLSLADVAAAAHFRSHTIPLDELPSLDITERYTSRDLPYFASNGVQAAHVEVDPGLGTIKLLGFWVVDDCGTVINPLLVDEQIRGGVVQGIGAALYEECIYNEDAQLGNGTLADYLVPMAGEMPDIHVAHIETPIGKTELGARGVGEAGTVAAAAAVWGAVNDALSPLGAVVTQQPITPEHVLDVIEAARSDRL